MEEEDEEVRGDGREGKHKYNKSYMKINIGIILVIIIWIGIRKQYTNIYILIYEHRYYVLTIIWAHG